MDIVRLPLWSTVDKVVGPCHHEVSTYFGLFVEPCDLERTRQPITLSSTNVTDLDIEMGAILANATREQLPGLQGTIKVFFDTTAAVRMMSDKFLALNY